MYAEFLLKLRRLHGREKAARVVVVLGARDGLHHVLECHAVAQLLLGLLHFLGKARLV